MVQENAETLPHLMDALRKFAKRVSAGVAAPPVPRTWSDQDAKTAKLNGGPSGSYNGNDSGHP